MSTLYLKVSEDWNENFLGYSVIAIIASTCLGGLAVMTAMMNGGGISQFVMVFMIVAACSIHNASILTVQKPNTVLNLLIASLLISSIVMLLNLFVI